MTDLPTFVLGEPVPLPGASDEMRHRLASRRSASAQTLTGTGPTREQIDEILQLGMRTPDHGKLFPWRFVVLGRQTRAGIAEALLPLAAKHPSPDKAAAVLGKLTAPPLTILVMYAPRVGAKIPEWEQVLSVGAVCMNLEHAAAALGFSTSWITDWYSYHREALPIFGVTESERIAGFIHIGHVETPPLERERPQLADRVAYHP